MVKKLYSNHTMQKVGGRKYSISWGNDRTPMLGKGTHECPIVGPSLNICLFHSDPSYQMGIQITNDKIPRNCLKVLSRF